METVFGIPVINILWTIVAGKRFQMEDPKVQRIMSLLNRYLRQTNFRREYIFETDQAIQSKVCPGVLLPLVGPDLLLHAGPEHQEEDHL